MNQDVIDVLAQLDADFDEQPSRMSIRVLQDSVQAIDLTALDLEPPQQPPALDLDSEFDWGSPFATFHICLISIRLHAVRRYLVGADR